MRRSGHLGKRFLACRVIGRVIIHNRLAESYHASEAPVFLITLTLSHAGAQHEGADSAVLLRATWRDTRRAVLKAGGVTEFAFRQYLFACQGRVLLRMRRPQEVCSDSTHSFLHSTSDGNVPVTRCKHSGKP